MPDRGVDRPPAPDEILQARRYATRLRQALVHGTRRIDKRTPGGRFDGRAYTRGQAQRATGRPVTTHPWQITRQLRAPIQTPHVALIIDTSGSMSTYEYALGPIAWILTDGLRQIDGRCAIALFGNGASLLTDGRHPLPLVPGIRTGGGTAFAGDAIALAADQLEMTNARRPRFMYVLSDGGWYDTAGGRGEDPLAARARRADHPHRDRRRAAVGRRRPHHRHRRPRRCARPGRRRHDRRPAGGRPAHNPRRETRMPNPVPALRPDPALFDVTTVTSARVGGVLERVALEHLTLAPNQRRHVAQEGIERLAGMLCRTGQLVPCIGHRPDPDTA